MANRCFAAMIGYAGEDLKDRLIYELLPIDDNSELKTPRSIEVLLEEGAALSTKLIKSIHGVPVASLPNSIIAALPTTRTLQTRVQRSGGRSIMLVGGLNSLLEIFTWK